MVKATLKVFQFKITLLGTEPPIWRRVQVDNFITLRRFAAVVLAVMGWNNSHLHRFEIDRKEYGMPDPDGLHDSKDFVDEKKKKLCNFSDDDLKKFTFTYDFGDGWDHRIELEEVFKFNYKGIQPKCIDGARRCPPDDCGGPGGYEDFLEAMKDPKHPEHESMREWIGGKFDPERFDLDSVNV